MWKAAADLLNKQLWTVGKWWSPSVWACHKINSISAQNVYE